MAEFHKHAEAEDPFEATAMFIENPPGYDGIAAMARAFVEEYAMMGWPRDRIMRLFREPRYAGAHAVYHQRGEAFITSLLDDVLCTGAGEEVPHA